MFDSKNVVARNKFTPRKYQVEFMRAVKNKGYKKAICAWPRRSGKDICAWNLLIRAAIKDPGTYIYCLPLFSMCRRVLIDSRLSDGSSFMDFIPHKLIAEFNQQEMKITLKNGSVIIMVGSDTPSHEIDNINAKGLVISEGALAKQANLERLRSMVTKLDGFLIEISTPRPKSDFSTFFVEAIGLDDWYTSELTSLL